MMHKTWFIPPDFTFTTKGPLRLGMVLPHWSEPTTVLAAVGSGDASKITLPALQTIIEKNHDHSRSKSRSNSLEWWLKFVSFASASAKTDVGKERSIAYSKTDHEIQTFSDPLLPETVTAIANLPAVRDHIESGMFGKCPIYIVSGLRIATSSFTVTKEHGSHFTVGVEGAGPPPEIVPVEVGGNMKHHSQKKTIDSYDTAPGIVFAYQLHMIRAGEATLFKNKAGFLTGDSGEKEEPLVLVEATQAEINKDKEKRVNYECEQVGEDEMCIYLPPGK